MRISTSNYDAASYLYFNRNAFILAYCFRTHLYLIQARQILQRMLIPSHTDASVMNNLFKYLDFAKITDCQYVLLNKSHILSFFK